MRDEDFDCHEWAVCDLAVKRYGDMAQVVVAMEELAELTQALAKWMRMCYHKDNADSNEVFEHIGEEMADVHIMMTQLELIFGDYTDQRKFKIERLAKRLDYLKPE